MLVGLVGLVAGNFLLMLIAVFGGITCYQQRTIIRQVGADAAFGEPEPKWDVGYYNQRETAPSRPGLFDRVRAKSEPKRRPRAKQKEARREAELDRILTKVKDEGLQSLTDREKRTLQEETERRNR